MMTEYSIFGYNLHLHLADNFTQSDLHGI